MSDRCLYYFDRAYQLGRWLRHWHLTREEAEADRQREIDETGFNPEEDEPCGEYGDVTEIYTLDNIPDNVSLPELRAILAAYGDPNSD